MAVTVLDPHRRGDTFRRTFQLGNDWVGSDFTGGVKFTLRTAIPASSVTDDTGAIYQASVAGGEISITGANGVIVIAAEDTHEWPAENLHFDLQGTITGTPNVVHTIDQGTIRILGDVTRS